MDVYEQAMSSKWHAAPKKKKVPKIFSCGSQKKTW